MGSLVDTLLPDPRWQLLEIIRNHLHHHLEIHDTQATEKCGENIQEGLGKLLAGYRV